MIEKFLIQCESDEDVAPCAASLIDGLPTLFRPVNENVFRSCLISIEGEIGGVKNFLSDGNFYEISEFLNGAPLGVAVVFCKKTIDVTGKRQHYVVDVVSSDLQQADILSAWSDGANVSWRDLDEAYGDSWLSACMKFSSHNEWIQNRRSNEVIIDVRGLKSIEQFYCHLGEELFGYRGYAGRDLDGLSEIIRKNDFNGAVFKVLSKRSLSDFFLMATHRVDYVDLFESVLIDAAIRIETV